MPTLGFLKKKRTKDDSPTSPTADKNTGSPLTQTTSRQSALFAEPESTFSNTHSNDSGNTSTTSPTPTKSAAAPTSTPQGMNNHAAGQLQGQNPSSNTQNVPSIGNMTQQPNYGGGGNDSGYGSADHSAGRDNVPMLNLHTTQKGSSNPVRETKGKYTLTDFQISRTLGTGSFGRVHLVQSKHNQRFYAVKVLKKQQVVKMKQVEHTNDERRMLQRCRHPFLITLWGTWQDSKNLYMVMDFIEGGELFSLLRKSQVCFETSLPAPPQLPGPGLKL